jgi:Superinfection immunity protein
MENFINGLLWVLSWNLIVAAYWTPTIIALARADRQRGPIVVINGLLGWSLIGWGIALAMAVRSQPRTPVPVSE